MVSFSLGKLKGTMKVFLPVVAGGLIGEIATSRIPVERYTQAIPFVKDLPGAAQKFIPGITMLAVTAIIFGTGALTGKWTIMSLLGAAALGVSVNLLAKGIQRGGTL